MTNGSLGSGDFTDWVAIFIAALAAFISVWSAWYTVKKSRQMAAESAREAAAATRAQNYARLHELLVDPGAASGRRKLFLCAADGSFPDRSDDSWDDINYSLALYDTLGGYIRRGLVDESLALDAWHHPLQNIANPVRAFMEHRARQDISQPWSFLMDLLRKAEAHVCTCPPQPGVEARP